MKIKSCYKYILRLMPCVLVAALLLSFGVPAHADAVGLPISQRFAAMVGAALTAMNITIQSVNAPLQDAYNFLSDPFDVVYTYSEQNLDQYFDQSTIQIWPDFTVIDGVAYTDVWLSHDAVDYFRVNAGDFKTAYSIASNTNGTYATGTGWLNGDEIFLVDSVNRTRSVLPTAYYPDQYYIGGKWTGSLNGAYFPVYYDGVNVPSSASNPFGQSLSQYVEVDTSSGQSRVVTTLGGSTNKYSSWRGSSSDFVSGSFDYAWTAGTIPADPVPGEEPGMMLRVPSTSPGLQDFIHDNPEYTQPGGNVVDVSVPGVTVQIEDLLDILAPVIPVISTGDKITYSDNHVTPPAATIADTDYSVLQQTLNTINNSINNIAGPIISAISTGVSTILDGLGDLVDRILEDIEIGPIKVFDKVLDLIKSIFLVPLNLLRSAVGIWSYVVNWLSSISAPVSWFLAIVSNSMSLMLSPVYACVAGAIVIAIYKRFGR